MDTASPLPRSASAHFPATDTTHPRAHGSAIFSWLELLDALLRAAEQTAWSARAVVEATERAFTAQERKLQGSIAAWSQQSMRFAQTAIAVGKIAAGYRLQRFESAFVSKARAERSLRDLHEKSARAFRELSAVHGGAFMKVGQLLSARADVLPGVWIQELATLQDRGEPVAFSAIRNVIEGEFGCELERLFEAFDEEPLASASIGQVHRAVTRDGRQVAVKVQRRLIESSVRADLCLLEALLRSFRSRIGDFDEQTLVNEIRRRVLEELDYVAEAQALQQVSDFFADDARVLVPRLVPALCGKRVLTTEFIEGEKITQMLERLEQRRALDPHAHVQSSAILGRLLEAYLRQVLELGIFQADPHPGNLLVTEDDRIVLLDFGCVGRLSAERRAQYLQLFQTILFGDRDGSARLLAELDFVTRSGRPDTLHAFADAFLSELRRVASGQALRWPTPEELEQRARDLLASFTSDPVIRIPSEFVMIARVFATLGGLFGRYRPELEFSRHVLPVLRRAAFAHATA